jgi:hypothetical protein
VTNLVEYHSGADGEPTPSLTEMRLGREPAMAMLFTAECEAARLHYIADDSVRSFLVCPGHGCPLCFAGVEPDSFHLLPVFDVEAAAVRVLRISARRQIGGLGALLVPHLRDKGIASKIVLIARNGPKYSVEVRPLAPHADRGEAQIKTFLDKQQAGLKLESAFLHMTAGELAEVPSIATKLAPLGGWVPPHNAAAGPASDEQTPNGESEES